MVPPITLAHPPQVGYLWRMRTSRFLLPIVLLACSGSNGKDDDSAAADTAASDADTDSDSDSDSDSDADADSDADSDSDADADCGDFSEMNPGDDWAWTGECPQMRTPCEISVDECHITIAYSSGMTMGMPFGGRIDADTITFDDDGVNGCVGTLSSADKATGTCEDGCTFTLRR